MTKVTIYLTSNCPYCTRAKNFLQNKGVPFDTIDLTHNPTELSRLKSQTQWMTVPQIFIGKHFIGGYMDMLKLEEEGKLDSLLNDESL